MAKLFYVVLLLASFLLACTALPSPPVATPAPAPWIGLVPGPGDAEAEKELNFEIACLEKLGNCSDALFYAFENQRNIEDPVCCNKLVRLGNWCWRFIITSYADQCHVLPFIMKRCKELVPNDATGASLIP